MRINRVVPGRLVISASWSPHIRQGVPGAATSGSGIGSLAAPEQILGGDPQTNADITRNILAGAPGPQRDVTLLNAAAALVAAGKAAELKEGIQLAEAAIDSGAAADKLKALIRFTNENA